MNSRQLKAYHAKKNNYQPKIYWAHAKVTRRKRPTTKQNPKGNKIIDKKTHFETKDGKLIYWDGHDAMKGIQNVLAQRALSGKPL